MAAVALVCCMAASAARASAGAHVVVVGGSRAQRQVARQAALRVDSATLRTVVFKRPSAIMHREGARGRELVVSSRGAGTLRAFWEQQLYIGTYLALAARNPSARVAAAATFQSEGLARSLAVYDIFGSNPPNASVASERMLLLRQARAAGARVIELRTIALPARLLAMTVRVHDPAAFLKHRTRALLRLLTHPRVPLLGYYLAVENGSGRTVWATSWLPGSGGLFAIPRLDACSPVQHTEPATRQPPPCPAR